MLTMPSSKRQANMVLAILLCNWLLLVAATAAQAAAPANRYASSYSVTALWRASS